MSGATVVPARPRVSVVIPCFNLGAYIDEAVSSVLDQPSEDVEIIIVNDGGNDDTASVTRRLAQDDPRIRLIDRSPPEGVGRALKEGLLSDQDNQKAILEVSTFASTAGSEPTTLAGYLERMKEGQEEIYYLTGESRTQVENSPHMEAFQAQGYEVLILTDPVDEIWVESAGDYYDVGQ